MRQTLFDFDLKRVSREHYITGKAAIIFPQPESTTGGWHFLSYFDREAGVAKVSLAGIHYPDTTSFFSDEGIVDVTDQMAKRGWFSLINISHGINANVTRKCSPLFLDQLPAR